MRNILAIVLAPAVLLAGAANAQQREIPADDACYSIGYALGQETLERLRADGVEIDADQLAQGLIDAMKGAEPRVDHDRMSMLLRKVEEEVRRHEAAARLESDPAFRALAQANLQRSKEFHSRVSQEENIKSMDGGIQYRVLEEGAGSSPTAGDEVVVTFKAATIDGESFAEAAHQQIPVSEVIEGAKRVLLQMRPGARWRVAIPPSLAFGEPGLPPQLGPNETVVVDVTLHSIVKDG